jgi:serine/threonine protein phosphatase PrpC
MINTDTFIEIGSNHQICEDYIISGNDLHTNYIILSDGCSTAKNSEMGARLLTYLAKQYLKYHNHISLEQKDANVMGQWIIHNAEMTMRQLGLERSCLDATLIISYVYKKLIHIYMYGDGVIVMKDRSGEIKIVTVDYTQNTPYYLSYLIDEKCDQLYYKKKIQKKITHALKVPGSSFDLIEAYDKPYYHAINMDIYPCVFVCSDGIKSFVEDNKIMDPYDYIYNFMNYKNTNGEFLKRRMKRALLDLSSDNIKHFDDLSIGAYLNLED